MSCNARVLMYQRNLQLQYLYNFELKTLSNIYNCKQVDILISKNQALQMLYRSLGKIRR